MVLVRARGADWAARALAGLLILMKSAFSILLFFLVVSFSQGAVVLRGLVVLGGVPMFALCDETTGKDSWLRIGDRIPEGVLTAYHKETGVLAITAADGKVLELAMPASVIQDSRTNEAAHGANAVYLSPEQRAKYRAEGKDEAAVLGDAIRSLEGALANTTDAHEKEFLTELVAGAKEGELSIIDTGGRPLKYGELEGYSNESIDRLNKLMTMTPEQVEAMIAERKKSGMPSK